MSDDAKERPSVVVADDDPPAAPATPEERDVDPSVDVVLEYVAAVEANNGCRLMDIANRMQLSRPTLSRRVLKATGLSFTAHLQSTRRATAAKLLAETSLSIKEISARTGFQHVPSFDRWFRRHFSITPGQFRRSSAMRGDGPR